MRALIPPGFTKSGTPSGRAKRVALMVLAALAFAGCKPAPPTIIPVQATLGSVTPAGVNLVVQLDATNPNRFDLSAQSLTAKVMLDHQYSVADVTTTGKAVTVPAKGHASIQLPVQVLWADMPSLAVLAANPSGVPYEVDGTVTIGGESFHADVPFHLEGTFSQQDLAGMLQRSIQGGLRGGMQPGRQPGMHPGVRPGMIR